MRGAIGLALAGERYGSRFFANDGTPGLAVSHQGELKKPAADRLKESIEGAFSSMENKHRVMVLEEGMTVEKITVPPDTAQFLESRRFQVRDIARWYRIPPHLIGDLENATFSNIAEQSLEFVKYTMLPYFRKFEQAISRDLIGREDEETHFAKFSLEGLLRGDPKARAEMYRTLWGIGSISQDEIRALEDMNPLPNGAGAVYYVPLNFTPTDQAGAEPARSDREARSLARAKTDAEGRRRTARAFEPTFKESATRVLRIERRDVLKAARQKLGAEDFAGFSEWLDNFYSQHERTVSRAFGGAVASLSELIAADAGGSVDTPIDPDRLEGFREAFLASLVMRHVESSRGQLKTLMESRPADAVAVLEARFDDWEEKRPARIASRETVQTSGAVTRFVFGAAGLGSIWTAFGKSCPFCESLAGQRVSGSESFAQKGQMLEAEGRNPLRLRTDILNPPIHGGCDCGLRPG